MAGTINSWNNQIASANSAITLNSGTNTISISTDASATTVNIATGGAAKSVTLGSTSTTSATAIKSGSGNIGLNSGLSVNTSGIMTNASQPAFHVYQSSTLSNATGDGTTVTVPYNTVKFDNSSSFNTGTYTFTAPITGKYVFGFNVYLNGIVAVNNSMTMILNTTSTSYQVFVNPYAIQASGTGPLIQYYTACVGMTVGDTAYVQVQVYATTKGVNIQAGEPYSFFWGYLVC